MRYKFTVYYSDEADERVKTKLINAKNEENAMEKFREKYPGLIPILVTK